jgi:hypothetical protein
MTCCSSGARSGARAALYHDDGAPPPGARTEGETRVLFRRNPPPAVV